MENIEGIKLTTLQQIKFYLGQDKVIFMKYEDGEGFIEKKGSLINIKLQSKSGENCEFESNMYKFDNFYNQFEGAMYYFVDDLKVATIGNGGIRSDIANRLKKLIR